MSDREQLEKFIIGNRDLERLEDLLTEFNIFEVLGIEKSETRHSAFLAWLLDPNGNHGLGNYFVRKFLLNVTSIANYHGIDTSTAFDVDGWKLSDLDVETELHKIDILLMSQEDGFVCALENKVSSGEHGNQLERYRDLVKREYGNLTPMFVYLTVDGDRPEKDEDAENYTPISYGQIAELIQEAVEFRSMDLGANVKGILEQYITSLRRHVLVDSEIQQLAQRIYSTHREALDLIYDSIPDVQQGVRRIVEAELENHPLLLPDESVKSYIRYWPKQLENIPELQKGSGWTASGRVLLVEFKNNGTTLSLDLVLGPGPATIRRQLYEHAKTKTSVFNRTTKTLNKKHDVLHRRQILNSTDYDEFDSDSLREKVHQGITEFVSDDLGPLIKQVKAAF